MLLDNLGTLAMALTVDPQKGQMAVCELAISLEEGLAKTYRWIEEQVQERLAIPVA